MQDVCSGVEYLESMGWVDPKRYFCPAKFIILMNTIGLVLMGVVQVATRH